MFNLGLRGAFVGFVERVPKVGFFNLTISHLNSIPLYACMASLHHAHLSVSG